VEIQGRTLPDAFVLPRGAVRDSGDVLIVDADSRLERRPVSVAWTDGEYAIVTEGIEAGDVINVTPLAVAASGTLVAATIDGVPPAPRSRPDADQVAGGRPQ